MNVLRILGIVLAIALFFYLGYVLWDISRKKYGFNIYGLGTVIRGLISYVTLYFGIFIETPDDRFVLLLITGILWLWTFLLT